MNDLLSLKATVEGDAEHGKSRSKKLISFIEAEVRARNIKESKNFARWTVCATVVIAISAVVSLVIAFFK